VAGDELVDLVDEHDRVLGTITRAEMRQSVAWHRAVYVMVQDRAGRVLLQQRSFDKDLAPGAWDIGAGGVVAAGESYDDAAQRELAEELGVRGVVLEPLGVVRFEGSGLRLHGRAYFAVHDGPFTFDDGEVLRVEWVEADALAAVVAARPFVPDSPEVFLPKLATLRTRTR
jgi:8-oxo-dGTP pyrophosphatase MutT (NUDIX family)